jgi:hypothetical protein
MNDTTIKNVRDVSLEERSGQLRFPVQLEYDLGESVRVINKWEDCADLHERSVCAAVLERCVTDQDYIKMGCIIGELYKA